MYDDLLEVIQKFADLCLEQGYTLDKVDNKIFIENYKGEKAKIEIIIAKNGFVVSDEKTGESRYNSNVSFRFSINENSDKEFCNNLMELFAQSNSSNVTQ